MKIKNKSYWKNNLTNEQYKVLVEKGTEPAFTGNLLNNKEKGVYMCTACGQVLFSSKTKYDSKSGWPSFYDVAKKGNIELKQDKCFGLNRVEVICNNCGGHLGHLFDDGPKPTKKRYCINSIALTFKKK